jgi:hypothetical protein
MVNRHSVAVGAIALMALGMHVAGQVPGQSATPAATNKAAISGIVTNGGTGQPLSSVLVTLSGGTSLKRQLTDARGRFLFRDLPAGGGYRISANHPAFLGMSFGQEVPLGPSTTIALTDGQWFAAANMRLWKPGAISGRVRDSHGEPVVGAHVRVLAQESVAGTTRLLAGAAAKTDDRGEYRIAGLLRSRYLVTVPSAQHTVPANKALDRTPETTRVDAGLDLDAAHRLIIGNFSMPPPIGGRVHAYPVTFHPGVTTPGAATAIDLALGEEKNGVDVVLQPVPTVRVAGQVQGPADRIGGVLLRLMLEGPPSLEALGNGSEAATTFTGADGRFVFLNVPAGSYVIDTGLRIELTFGGPNGGVAPLLPAPAGSDYRGQGATTLSGGPPGFGYQSRGSAVPDRIWTRTPVSVGGSDLDGVVVVLNPTMSIAGRFVFEGASHAAATTITAGGRAGGTPTLVREPVALPTRLPEIRAYPAAADGSLGMPRSDPFDTSQTDGFLIEGLRSGTYVFHQDGGTARYIIKSIDVGGRDVAYVPFEISRSLTGVVVTMTDQIPSLGGTVATEPRDQGRAAVIVFPVERDRWTRYGFSPARLLSAPTPSGAFLFAALPAGEYFVVAVDVAHVMAWQDPKFLERASAVAARVRLGWGEKRRVDLTMTRVK